MTWTEIRKAYPNQFLLLKILDYHDEGSKRYIDEVEVIRPIEDYKEVARLTVNRKSDELVYHTKNVKIILIVRKIDDVLQ